MEILAKTQEIGLDWTVGVAVIASLVYTVPMVILATDDGVEQQCPGGWFGIGLVCIVLSIPGAVGTWGVIQLLIWLRG